MYSGRVYMQSIHRLSQLEIDKLKKLGWLKLSKSVGKPSGYVEIEAKTDRSYLSMVYRIRYLDNNLSKSHHESHSMKINICDMGKITNSEIKKLREREIRVVKYDNELPIINDHMVWCTVYADDKCDLNRGCDRILKLLRGDILRGSKWCGKHYRFSN